jgi:5-methyltetrahydrofolate--homocysteine methyltransferase
MELDQHTQWFNQRTRMTFMNEKLQTVYQAVLDGDMPAAQGSVKVVIDSGVSAAEILNSALIPAMGEVGRLFEEGEYFVPEMLIAARAMKAALEIIKPLLVDSGVEPIGKFAVGTVTGDLHDIGKNLVAMMMEGAGFEIVDLGTDVNPNDFVSAAKDGANVIGLSALLTTTMPNMAGIIKTIEEQSSSVGRRSPRSTQLKLVRMVMPPMPARLSQWQKH